MCCVFLLATMFVSLFVAVSWMVSVLPIDCSRYSLDILKKSVGLFSSQPTTRDGMVGLVSSLARQTSDGQVAFDMLGQLLAELKGKPSLYYVCTVALFSARSQVG